MKRLAAEDANLIQAFNNMTELVRNGELSREAAHLDAMAASIGERAALRRRQAELCKTYEAIIKAMETGDIAPIMK